MLESASAIGVFSLERWVRLPAARARCVGHFLAIAATLAGAKVLLSTIAVTLFVAEQGAAGLPPFYVGFAAIAILLSFGLSSIIDRAPKVRLAQITFAALLVGTAALRLLLALEVPGVSFALLASATAFEIIFDIVFWVVVAAYLDAFEFRRATPLLYMALALGGAVGGVLARISAGAVHPADLLILLIPAAVLVVVQLGAVASRLREVPEYHADAADGAAERPGLVVLAHLLKRYPLALLIALNALIVTLLYGLSEYLIILIYEARFTSEGDLAQFLAVLFALMQIMEFVVLYTLTRVLLEHSGPWLRNMLFPLTSLAGLIFLVFSPRLIAAVVVHVNIEAVSNALFLPISNANYVPLPLGVQGRARTLSEGIFYPAGLALAGAVLWTADPEGAVLQVEFAALVFAGLFVLLGAGVGLLFLPTLHANLGTGLIVPGRALGSEPPAPAAARVGALLQSREPELRLLGIALARRLDPVAFGDALRALATRPDRATREALAHLVAAAPQAWAQGFLESCLAGGTEEELKLALLVLLIRRAPLAPEHVPCVLDARDPAIRAFGYLVADGLKASGQIQSLVREPRVASDLLDAIACAGRTDCLPLLLLCLEAAEPEQRRRALGMLNSFAAASCGAAAEVLRPLARSSDGAVRAEAIALLAAADPGPAALRRLVAALDDSSPRVRRRAAQALRHHGDRAASLLSHRLSRVTMASVNAVWALAHIGTPGARRLLAAHVQMLQQDAEGIARLRARIAEAPDRARWAALEHCLDDHHARIVDVVLAALSPAIDARLMTRLRLAMHGDDQRHRASAFELVAAGPASRLIPGAVALLRFLLFERAAGRLAGSARDRLPDQAMASLSPWVRRAASLAAMRPALSDRTLHPARGAGSFEHRPAGDPTMEMDDQEFERIVALKRTPPFRHVPFETLIEVARSVQARLYLAGEQVITDGLGGQVLLILEAGVLAIGDGAGARQIQGPDCFGEAAVAGEPMPWPRIVAVEDSRVSFLRAAVFQELCEEHPEMALELCRLLARRLREAGAGAP